MRKAMIATVIVLDVFLFAMPGASATTSSAVYTKSPHSIATSVKYYANGHHWNHRAKRHGHWHYY
jgi:hypothetical protein